MGKNIICDIWIDDGDLKKLEQHDFTIGKIIVFYNVKPGRRTSSCCNEDTESSRLMKGAPFVSK